MKFNVKGQIPSPDLVGEGLRVDNNPGVTMARDTLGNAREEQERARRRLAEAGQDLARLRIAVPRGEASTSALDQAIVSQRSAALVIDQYDARVTEADRALTGAIATAKAEIVREAGRRRDKLQVIADELAPALSALREAEAALDEAVRAVGLQAGVVALEWPSSLAVEATSNHNIVITRMSEPRGAA
jgi:hypothetical protein